MIDNLMQNSTSKRNARRIPCSLLQNLENEIFIRNKNGLTKSKVLSAYSDGAIIYRSIENCQQC